MERLARAGGYLGAVAGAAFCLAAAAWPAAAQAQVFGDTTERVNVTSDGTEANGTDNSALSSGPAISADGRFIAFFSDATNLVAGDTNGYGDVFVHDRQAGVTERINVASDGSQGHYGADQPAISADGRFVAFFSWASNLVADDTNDWSDIFVRDRQTGATERVSIASDGSESNHYSDYPAISGDGRFVTFHSDATNLVAGDTNGSRDIFIHDRQTGVTERVSVASNGVQGNSHSQHPAISADGRYVAFESFADNLVSDDTNELGDVFVHDRQTGITERISVASNGRQATQGFTGDAAISADGRFVGFTSSAASLIADDTNADYDVFVHDRYSGTTERVSISDDGNQGNDGSGGSSLSADGRFVAFTSYASNLVAGDTNGKIDIFVRDRLGATTERVNLASDGSEPGGFDSEFPAISADAQIVAFESNATNLVNGDTNGQWDIFVRFSSGPVAPVAYAGGPYGFCANVGALVLDGTGSYNRDEGRSEAGAPGDTIQAYEWDLDDDGTFDDAVGAEPEVTGIFDTAPAGTYSVALKVTDTTATAFPSSGLADQSGVDTAEVIVYEKYEPSCACVGTLAARTKSNKVQLSWTDVGAPGGYRLYRADLPGGQSRVIASVPPGYLYVDGDVVNGRSYGYALVTIAANGGETCQSNAVIATPRGR